VPGASAAYSARPGHPNLNQAATHLGVRKAALTPQVDHLEQAVGATLLETTPDPGGIILTPASENSHKNYHQSWPCSTEQVTTP
jgi:DNA-binding transcriptional LysR family regulator